MHVDIWTISMPCGKWSNSLRDRGRVTAASSARARRSTLTTALAFSQLPPHAPELQLLHRWLESWPGIGDIGGGMRRRGYDLQLTSYGNGMWRATFWVTGTLPPALGGSAYEATAWGAVQRAAWAAAP